MEIQLDNSLEKEIQIQEADTGTGKNMVKFIFKGRRTIAIYDSKKIITMMKDVNIIDGMVDLEENKLALKVSDNCSVIISSSIIYIFKDEHGEIVFFPKECIDIGMEDK